MYGKVGGATTNTMKPVMKETLADKRKKLAKKAIGGM